MVNHIKVILVILGTTVLFGCASDKIVLTQSLINEYDLSPQELSKLQYFVSDETTFRHIEDPSSGREVAEGKLFTEAGILVEDVVIEEDTPGILVDMNAKKQELFVSFEEGSSFPFHAYGQDKFTLKYARTSRNATFNYAGKEYYLTNLAGDVYLRIRKQSLENIREKRKVLPGRILEEYEKY